MSTSHEVYECHTEIAKMQRQLQSERAQLFENTESVFRYMYNVCTFRSVDSYNNVTLTEAYLSFEGQIIFL